MATHIPRMSEADEQIVVIKWANMMASKYPCLKYLFHIPNGGSRNIAEAANLKRMGVKSGVPDLCLPYPSNGYHGLYIEMKTDKGRSTAAQREYIDFLTEQWYKATVCHGASEAINVIWKYLTENVKEYDMLESENREQGVYVRRDKCL